MSKLNQKEDFEILYNEFNKRVKDEKFEDSLSLVNNLLNIAESDIDIFYTLMGKSTVQTHLNKNDDAIITYNEIIEKFNKTSNKVIFKFLAYAYFNMALIYGKQNNLKKELETYNILLEKYIFD
ncbi:MAG: hypothetical protein GY932_03770, partial [Arcobacter sp.]|nr:hypothetical protein [Arcobacter sp.]